eukprot:6486393-Amphidinium_carterae.3
MRHCATSSGVTYSATTSWRIFAIQAQHEGPMRPSASYKVVRYMTTGGIWLGNNTKSLNYSTRRKLGPLTSGESREASNEKQRLRFGGEVRISAHNVSFTCLLLRNYIGALSGQQRRMIGEGVLGIKDVGRRTTEGERT